MPQQPTSQSYTFNAAGAMGARTSSPVPMQPQYGEDYRLSSAYDTSRSVPRPVPSTSLGSSGPVYSSAGYVPRSAPTMGAILTHSSSPNIYESSIYGHQMPVGQQMQMPGAVAYEQQVYGSPSMQSLPRSMSNMSSASSTRSSSQKPKPQCWEHGCNGRRFSTFSNLLRHQREKSGTAAKSYCPRCGAEFTRTTARNGHLAHEKCSKQRRATPETK
ncbi:hypothetical protein ANO11243_075310 [Dothideomycetidae sp. 11243]|nr:hypothetical protein ANO11243_075310 [fungal sp. No.11243]